MKIFIYNNQKTFRISKNHLKKQIKEILKHEKVGCDELSLHLVDEKTISNLHDEYFNDPKPTDCISFPIDPPNSPGYCILGEVFVCSDIAEKYAESHNINPYDELTLYVIHGLLHLIGYDDISEKEKIIMRKKEKSCMDLIKDKNLGICTKHTKQLKNINE
jgi:probable rRNA maturation factor